MPAKTAGTVICAALVSGSDMHEKDARAPGFNPRLRGRRMATTDGAVPYVLGHSEQELARLEKQGELFGAETRQVLVRAGLAPGMRVLDVGCGAGDVSLIAAELVGPAGTVIGIDRA